MFSSVTHVFSVNYFLNVTNVFKGHPFLQVKTIFYVRLIFLSVKHPFLSVTHFCL